MKTLACVMALAAILAFAKVANAEEKIRVSDQPIESNAQVVPFHVTDAFQVIIAAYEADMKEILADSNLTDEEKAVAVQRINRRIGDFYTIHDRIVDVTEVVVSIGVHLGAEVPFSFTKRLTKNIGTVGTRFTTGFTLVASRNRKDNKAGVKQFHIGLSSLAGVNYSVESGTAGRAGSTGIQWVAPAVVAVIPINGDVPTRKFGDLQGWYFGAAAELNTDTGNHSASAGTIQFGAYLRPNGLEMPDAVMVMASRGIGGQRGAVNGQLEAVHFSTYWGSDGTTFRAPLPGFPSYSSSEHKRSNRMKEFSSKELREAIQRSEQQLLEAR